MNNNNVNSNNNASFKPVTKFDGVAGLDAIVANARSRAHEEMQSLLQESHKMMEQNVIKQRERDELLKNTPAAGSPKS